MKKNILKSSPKEFLILFCPVLMFPAVFLPYKLWGVVPFANLVRFILEGQPGNALWLAFHASETVIFFWFAVSIAVMAVSAAIAALRVRPWYFIPVYLLVMASLSGISALMFYSIMAS